MSHGTKTMNPSNVRSHSPELLNEAHPSPATIVLNVSFTPDYPDEPPRLDITNPPNAPKHPHLDIQTDKDTLLSLLNETISENLGMPMIFTLVSTLKDGAELLITERLAAQQAILDMEQQRLDEEENRKFQGTAVTRESFLAWREKFRAEAEAEERRRVEEKEADDKKRRIKEEKKLTGKELWQQGLAGKVEDDDEEGDDALEGMERLKVAAA